MTDWRLDNPAGRLHVVVSKLQSLPGGRPIRKGWELVFQVDGEPDYLLLRRMHDISDLVLQATEAVEAFEDVNRDLHLRWVTPMINLLAWAGRFDDQLSQLQSQVTEAQMVSLELCADFLHRQAAETVLESESIDGLIDLVRAAMDAIMADDNLPQRVRHHLVGRLRDVEAALHNVRICGYAGVEQAMETFTGAMAMSPDARSSDETRGWWAKLWANIGLASTGTRQLSESAESVAKAIEAITGSGG